MINRGFQNAIFPLDTNTVGKGVIDFNRGRIGELLMPPSYTRKQTTSLLIESKWTQYMSSIGHVCVEGHWDSFHIGALRNGWISTTFPLTFNFLPVIVLMIENYMGSIGVSRAYSKWNIWYRIVLYIACERELRMCAEKCPQKRLWHVINNVQNI